MHEVMSMHRDLVEQNHFACMSEELWGMLKGIRFWTKVAELSI